MKGGLVVEGIALPHANSCAALLYVASTVAQQACRREAAGHRSSARDMPETTIHMLSACSPFPVDPSP